MGKLILIIGTMKSGKSFDLISYFAPLKFTSIPYALFQPILNVRDKSIKSRNGTNLKAKKIATLFEIKRNKYKIIGIDEVHMFDPSDANAVAELLIDGAEIIVSGLDTDYRGKLFPIVGKLLALGPDKVKFKKAVCDNCKTPKPSIPKSAPLKDRFSPV